MSRLEELQRELEAAEAESKAVALSEEEQAEAALVARIAAAREEKAAAQKAKRAIDLAARERAARAKLGPKVLIRGIDLIDLFPLGHAPDADVLPGKGVIIVRGATTEALKAFHREAEAKDKPLAELYADVLCASCIDPDVRLSDTEGARLRAFCDEYGGAAIGAGEIAVKLGGSKIKADKRGRS